MKQQILQQSLFSLSITYCYFPPTYNEMNNVAFFSKFCQISTLSLHLVNSSHHGVVGSASAWQTRGLVGSNPCWCVTFLAENIPVLSWAGFFLSIQFFSENFRENIITERLEYKPETFNLIFISRVIV